MRGPALALLTAAIALAVHLAWQAGPAPALPIAPPPRIADSPSPRIQLTATQRQEAASVGGFVVVPKSLLRVQKPMRYGDFLWNDDGVPSGPVSIRVDLRTQIMSIFRGGHEIGTAVVLYGADSKETPVGQFPILWKGKDHYSSLYDAPMPFTLRLTGDGVAIHGSDVRWGAATHGCIGVPADFARRLYAEVKVGDPVVILRSMRGA